MPSYRLHLPIGALREGASPDSVLEQAVLALGSLHAVERKDVEAPLVGGRRIGRIVLRFGVEPSSRAAEDDAARHALAAVVEHLEETVCEIAPVGAVVLSRGAGGRFRPIPPSLPGA
jgi:hypothetical protein